MRRTLQDDNTNTSEFERTIASARRSLWRFEQQPRYIVDDEAGLLADFIFGMRRPATDAPGIAAWLEQVAAQRRAGISVGRARVVDDPPTSYQQWLAWIDQWNTAAGEEIYYLPRATLARLPVEPTFGLADWWLIDERVAVIMHVDEAGRRYHTEITDEPSTIRHAISFSWAVRAQARRARSLAA